MVSMRLTPRDFSWTTRRTALVTSTFDLSPVVLTPTHPSDTWLSPCNASKNQQWGLCSFLLSLYSTTGRIHIYPNVLKKIFFSWSTAAIFSARTQDSVSVHVLPYSACSHLCHTSSSDIFSALGCQYTQKWSSGSENVTVMTKGCAEVNRCSIYQTKD